MNNSCYTHTDNENWLNHVCDGTETVQPKAATNQNRSLDLISHFNAWIGLTEIKVLPPPVFYLKKKKKWISIWTKWFGLNSVFHVWLEMNWIKNKISTKNCFSSFSLIRYNFYILKQKHIRNGKNCLVKDFCLNFNLIDAFL